MATGQKLAEVMLPGLGKRRRYAVLGWGQCGFRPYDRLNGRFLSLAPPPVPRRLDQARAEWQAATKAAAWSFLKNTTEEDYKLLEVESKLDRRAA